jgi:hypothetical protein
MDPDLAYRVCGFPEALHPVSRLFLDHFLAGRMSTGDFLRFFSLPNSDYIPLARCLVTALGG